MYHRAFEEGERGMGKGERGKGNFEEIISPSSDCPIPPTLLDIGVEINDALPQTLD